VKPIPLNDAASHEKALEEMLERVLNHQATWPEFIALHNKRSAEVVRQIERRKGLS
jgi:lipopolysaccharide biosynthesis protein